MNFKDRQIEETREDYEEFKEYSFEDIDNMFEEALEIIKRCKRKLKM